MGSFSSRKNQGNGGRQRSGGARRSGDRRDSAPRQSSPIKLLTEKDAPVLVALKKQKGAEPTLFVMMNVPHGGSLSEQQIVEAYEVAAQAFNESLGPLEKQITKIFAGPHASGEYDKAAASSLVRKFQEYFAAQIGSGHLEVKPYAFKSQMGIFEAAAKEQPKAVKPTQVPARGKGVAPSRPQGSASSGRGSTAPTKKYAIRSKKDREKDGETPDDAKRRQELRDRARKRLGKK